jgi:hypothetical protein
LPDHAPSKPDLTLRKVTGHPQARDAYRVIHNGVEIGSIGEQTGTHQQVFWQWGIDTVLPRQSFATEGKGRDREDCMKQFRAVWEVFVSEPQRLSQFMEMKSKRR